jgi:hypothetical protein
MILAFQGNRANSLETLKNSIFISEISFRNFSDSAIAKVLLELAQKFARAKN